MLSNLELIKPLLDFSQEGDFFYLMLMSRKKDQPDARKKVHQSMRMIKTYCIDSFEYLEDKWDEIVGLCEFFRARAYIHVQKQNHKDVNLNMMVELATRIKNGVTNQRGLFDSVVGSLKVLEKRWVIDLDFKEEEKIKQVEDILNDIVPLGNKIIAKIPTRNGVHLITSPFNSQQFGFRMPVEIEYELQKKNPTLLYFPDSLEIDKNDTVQKIKLEEK